MRKPLTPEQRERNQALYIRFRIAEAARARAGLEKRCYQCGQTKPRTEFAGNLCKNCEKAYQKQYYERNHPERISRRPAREAKRRARAEHAEKRAANLARSVVEKRCGRCKEWKPRDAFGKGPGLRDGLAYRCRACNTVLHAIWYAKNPERNSAKQRDWIAANPEKVRAARRAGSNSRRARELSASGKPYTAREFRALCDESSWQCSYCAVVLDVVTAQADHIVPLSRGGSSDIGNIAVACRFCNSSKHNALLAAWLSRTGRTAFGPNLLSNIQSSQ
jgi:hypothetical protein